MWCVKCGSRTAERDGTLVCVATGQNLSSHARHELERLVDDPVSYVPPASNPEFKWGCRWFCPADGLPLREVEARLVCDECGRVVSGRLIYELSEFNYHP